MHKADLTLDTFFRRCHGFSVVELMVAMVITLILLAGIGQIYLSSKKSFTIQDTQGRQQENARYAMEMIAPGPAACQLLGRQCGHWDHKGHGRDRGG